MREIGVTGGASERGTCCCPPRGGPQPSERAARTRRIRRAFLLLASAAGLAWLGPQWHVSRFLVVSGSAVLLAFWAAALFSRAEPGALPRRAGPVAFLIAVGVLIGPWISLQTERPAPVLAEVFLPARAFVGDAAVAEALGVPPDAWGQVAAEWSLPVLDREPFAAAIAEGRLLCVALDLRREPARERLGVLAGLGEAVPEEDALEIDAPVAFVNGAPVVAARREGIGSASPSVEGEPPASRADGAGIEEGQAAAGQAATERQSGSAGASPSTQRSRIPPAFEATLEWELGRRVEPRVLIVDVVAGEGGAVAVRAHAPRGAGFRLYLLERIEDPGWWRAAGILAPGSIEVRTGVEDGDCIACDPATRPGVVEQWVQFAPGPEGLPRGGETVRLLVVSLDGTVIGTRRIP